MNRKINKGRLFRNSILLLLILGIVGLYFSNRFVKTKGFEGIGDFISTYNSNKNLANNVNPKSIQILMADADFDFLKNKRQESLDRGVQVNKGDNYVKCKVVFAGDTTKGEIRLKGHMTDHLEGIKWSFRVKTKNEVMGMYRFSLQNPGTRNYAYEWVYHALLANENVIHLKYDFITLNLNGTDLGIYAIEEHFGQHILRDNNRPKGAILRWNPELYWEQRLDEMKGVYLDEGYSNYSSSFAEPYDRGVVKKDSVLVHTYQMGAALLEAFRRGDRTATQVFDIEKMARFHAVIDLVGGYHSLDWSDVKFFYNSETGKVEPVGYESFSVRETIKIAGQRTPENYETIGFNYHDILFADKTFFKAYIKNLERICSEDYFNAFTTKIKDTLDLKRGVLAKEFAYIKFSFQPYYKNIELINNNINLPKPLHAFLENKTDSTLQISLSPVSDFPIEILALSVNDKKEYALNDSFILPPKARNTYAHYFDIVFNHQSKKIKNLKIKAKIPGSSTVFQIEVSDLPSYRINLDSVITAANSDSIGESNLLKPINDSVVVFTNATIEISNTISIPATKILQINKGQNIVFLNNGKLIINGKFNMYGTATKEITITEKGAKQTRIQINNGEMTAINCQFIELNANCIQATNSQLSFQNCIFAEITSTMLMANLSEIQFINCASGNMYSLGKFDRCIVKMKNFTAKNGNLFITSIGSDIEMLNSSISNYKALTNLDFSSNFSTWDSKFNAIDLLAELNNSSIFNCYAGTILASNLGFKVDLESIFESKSSYLLYKTNSEIKTMEKRKEG